MSGKNTFRFGIGRKIQIGVVIVVLLPMIIGGSVSYYIYRNQQKASAISNLQDFASECGKDISYYINTQFEVTRLVANNDVFQGGDYEVIQKYIESIMELYPNFAVVSIIDPDGKIVANSQNGLIGVSRTDRDWFQETIKLKEGEILPLDAYRAETSGGAMVIGLNTPIEDKTDRDLIGVLVIRLKVDYIIEKIRDLYYKAGYGRHTFLINSKGKILSSPDKNEILDPNHLFELFEASDSLPRGETGILENMKYCEKELIHVSYALMGYNDFNGFDWKIIASEDPDIIYKTAFMLRDGLIVSFFYIAVIVSLFAPFIIRKISQPIEEISVSALYIANGYTNPSKIEYNSNDEIGDLVHAFNTMSENLNITTVSRNSLVKEIDERKQAEKALWESKEKSEIQQQKLIQTEKLASLGVLVAGVAHEVNNPNHTIMVSAGLVSDSWKSITSILEEYYEANGDFLIGGINYTEMKTEIPEYLKAIIYGSERIDNIVQGLDHFTRKAEYKRTENVNLKNIIDSVIGHFSKYIIQATKNFSVELEEEIPPMKGNSQKLEQVMINLIENACQSLTNKNESIFIALHYDKQTQCNRIIVRDEGEGITSDNLKRVRDPFFTTKGHLEGTGLGLSICVSIIETHGGTLNIKSEVGKGTTVIISLPVESKKLPGDKK